MNHIHISERTLMSKLIYLTTQQNYHFKNATDDNTSNLVAKSDLASLKAETDQIDVSKLKTVCVDLSKFSDVVNNEVVKKSVYDKLVTKVNNIDTSGFVLKTKYTGDKPATQINQKISEANKKKILIQVNLSKKITDYNPKISEIESKNT